MVSIDPTIVTPLIASGFGASIFVGLLALRRSVISLFDRHCRSLKNTLFLFTPRAISVSRIVLSVYAGYAVLLVILISITPNLLIGSLLWAVSFMFPGATISYLTQRRRKLIDQQLPRAITSLSNCVRSGLTLVQSIGRVSRSAPFPVSVEFTIMHNRYQHGANLEQTILEAKERLRLENFNIFASALLVNREMGGDIVTTLDRISQSLIKLAQMRRTVEVHTAEGRMNIKVLVAAPILMLLLLSSVDGEGVALLFSTPQGWAVLIAAGLLIGFGAYWASRIVRTPI